MSPAVWVGLIALLGVDAETGTFMVLYLDLAWQKAIVVDTRPEPLRNRKLLILNPATGCTRRITPLVLTRTFPGIIITNRGRPCCSPEGIMPLGESKAHGERRCMRLLVRSFVCCVLATGARGQPNVTVVYPPPAQNPPVVVVLDSPPPRPAEFHEPYAPARQITYLIAFKDNVVRVADQYWVSGKTIYFLTTDHHRMTAPVSSVDRKLSKRLNSEQNVAFVLPPEPGKTVARARLVRTSLVRKRCHCVPDSSARAPSRASGGASRSSPEAPAGK
jgi:hypothetical protein